MINGRVNPTHTLETQGIRGLGNVYYNYLEPALVQEALEQKWGKKETWFGSLWECGRAVPSPLVCGALSCGAWVATMCP